MGSHDQLCCIGMREVWKDPECHLDLEVVIHGITWSSGMIHAMSLVLAEYYPGKKVSHPCTY